MNNLSSRTISTIEKEMNYWRIPGAAVAVVKDGKLWYSGGFGFRNCEGGLPADANTQFCIASCSKSMTSALISVLVDKGILSFDEPVITYAPKLIMQDPAARTMSLRDILSHKTGFGAHDAIWPGDRRREELAVSLRYIQPCIGFRGEAIYSNVMYAMAGYVAECATGKSWDELMQKYIFEPLKMMRTNCSADIMKNDDNYAVPYRYINGKLSPLEIWNVDLAGPAASVNSTAEDMAKWLMMHISGGRTSEGWALIQPSTFIEMHSVHSQFDDSVGGGDGFYECIDYSMGWKTGNYKGHKLKKHTGKIEGYSSIQAFLPDDGIGVVILTNFHSPTVPFMYGSLYTILDEVLGLEYEEWRSKFHGDALPEEEEYLDCDVNYFDEEKVHGTHTTLPLKGYEGTYFNRGYGILRIAESNNVLHMLYRDMDIPLEHYHNDVFKADGVKEDILTITLPVSFEVDNGTIKAAAVRFEPMVPDIVFIREE